MWKEGTWARVFSTQPILGVSVGIRNTHVGIILSKEKRGNLHPLASVSHRVLVRLTVPITSPFLVPEPLGVMGTGIPGPRGGAVRWSLWATDQGPWQE